MAYIFGLIIIIGMFAAMLSSMGMSADAILLTVPFVLGGGLLLFVILKFAHGIKAHFPEDESIYPKNTKYTFVGRFSTNREARTMCDLMNQNGDGLYVKGASIYTDKDVDVKTIRAEMGRQHNIYNDV